MQGLASESPNTAFCKRDRSGCFQISRYTFLYSLNLASFEPTLTRATGVRYSELKNPKGTCGIKTAKPPTISGSLEPNALELVSPEIQLIFGATVKKC